MIGCDNFYSGVPQVFFKDSNTVNSLKNAVRDSQHKIHTINTASDAYRLFVVTLGN